MPTILSRQMEVKEAPAFEANSSALDKMSSTVDVVSEETDSICYAAFNQIVFNSLSERKKKEKTKQTKNKQKTNKKDKKERNTQKTPKTATFR